jgi:hypothetical protein
MAKNRGEMLVRSYLSPIRQTWFESSFGVPPKICLSFLYVSGVVLIFINMICMSAALNEDQLKTIALEVQVTGNHPFTVSIESDAKDQKEFNK